MSSINERLADKALRVRCTPEALDYLAEVGYDPVYGARPLQRAVRRELETPLARAILQGRFKDGDEIVVGVVNDRICLLSPDGLGEEESGPPGAGPKAAAAR